MRIQYMHTELYKTLVLLWSCNCVGTYFSTLVVLLLLIVTCFASLPTWGAIQNKQPHPGLGKNQCPGLNWHSVSRLLLNPSLLDLSPKCTWLLPAVRFTEKTAVSVRPPLSTRWNVEQQGALTVTPSNFRIKLKATI